MGLNLLNKDHFHFVCTNFGSNKDGIGHYTSKVVNELKKQESFKINAYSSKTIHLSKLKLFLSLRMSSKLIKVIRNVFKNRDTNNYVILEYPFVEYNPIFLGVIFFLKLFKKPNTKIVISLHEYSRTKTFRKIFIKLLIPNSDIVLYTKNEDIAPFLNMKIIFRKRIIPANIEPQKLEKRILKNQINICFFGIINFETKEINNMIKAWELYLKRASKSKIQFHFISSSYDENIASNKKIQYHYDFQDDEVSELLQDMQFMVLPLKPKISVNNGSLSVGCIHKCIPVGMFDDEYFEKKFGLKMKNYSIEEFIKIFKQIDDYNVDLIENKVTLAYKYGKLKSIKNCADSYSQLVESIK